MYSFADCPPPRVSSCIEYWTLGLLEYWALGLDLTGIGIRLDKIQQVKIPYGGSYFLSLPMISFYQIHIVTLPQIPIRALILISSTSTSTSTSPSVNTDNNNSFFGVFFGFLL